MTFGQEIRKAREDHGWTQHELAIEAGLTDSQITHIEKGTYVSTMDTMRKVAKPFKAQVMSGDDGPRLVMPPSQTPPGADAGAEGSEG